MDGLALRATFDLVNLLLDDSELTLLYPTAISKVGSKKFIRNFARILRQYGRNLQGEASGEPRFQAAASFVRRAARRTAAEIERRVNLADNELFGTREEEEYSKAASVNAWLECYEMTRCDHSITHSATRKDALYDNTHNRKYSVKL